MRKPLNALQCHVGNVISYQGVLYKLLVSSESHPILDTPEFGAHVIEWSDLEPVKITVKLLLQYGFTLTPDSVLNLYFKSIGWDEKKRYLIVFLHPNMTNVFIKDGAFLIKESYSNLSCIFSSYFQGDLYLHTLQNIYTMLTELELNPLDHEIPLPDH